MDYTTTDWIEGVTPVNPTNLNKIEQGIKDSFKTENVNMLSDSQFSVNEPATSYPLGISTMRVAEGVDGWHKNGTVVTFRAGNNTDHFYAHQKLFQTGDVSSKDTLIRYGYQTTWLNWDTVWNSRNASVIVEEGSNANGKYSRWSDGLQIATNTISYTFDSDKTLEFTYPASFVGAVIGSGSIKIATANPTRLSNLGDTIITSSTIGWVVSSKSYNSETWDIQMIAIGRWK